MSRDSRRSAVYASEDQLRRLLVSGGVIDFHGSTLDIAPERKFHDLVEIQQYLDELRDSSKDYSEIMPPRITASRATTTAEWRAPNLIRVPAKQG